MPLTVPTLRPYGFWVKGKFSLKDLHSELSSVYRAHELVNSNKLE